MFESEFVLKQKAQLKYLQQKQNKKTTRMPLMNMLSHEFLWSPTPIYYLGAMILYTLGK
jgi:hypothetical protein